MNSLELIFREVVQDDLNIREQEIKHFFLKMQDYYVQVALNPFYEMNSQITSLAFEKSVAVLVNKGISSEKQ